MDGKRLDGRAAVITGAANGLGQAIAERFAAHGAKLVLGDIEADNLERTAERLRADGAEVACVAGDLTTEADARALIERAIADHGRVDVLVNNLGGARRGKIWELSPEDWDFTIGLNLRSLFLCTRFAVPHMIERKAGNIICLSSGAREGTPWTAYYSGGSAYSTCKAGVHGFMRDVAMELAEHGIRVNAIAPGPIDTERAGPNLKELNRSVERSPNLLTPLGRLGLPGEVADAALFLASDESTYVTGHNLSVAGGR